MGALGCNTNDNTSTSKISNVNLPKFKNTTTDSVLLRYKWTKDQKIISTVGINMKMEMKAKGQAFSIPMNMGMQIMMDIKDVDKDNNASILLMFKYMTMNMTVPGAKEINFDSRKMKTSDNPAFKPMLALINKKISLKSSPRGKILKINIDEMLNNFKGAKGQALKGNIKQSLDQMMKTAFVALPEKAVKAGDIYDGGTVSQEIPNMGKMEVTMKYKVHSVSGDKTKVMLIPMGSFRMLSSKNAMVKMEIKSGKIGGWMEFDLVKGNMMKGNMKTTMDINASSGGRSFDITSTIDVNYSSIIK